MLPVVDHLEPNSLVLPGAETSVTLAAVDVLTGVSLRVDEDVGEMEVLVVVAEGLKPDVVDEAKTSVVDVVEFAAIEKVTVSALVILTEDTIVVEETGKRDVDGIVMLGLRLNVDCDVVLTAVEDSADSVSEMLGLDDVVEDDNGE